MVASKPASRDPLADQLVGLEQRGAQREQAVLRRHGAQPDLEVLLAARDVGEREGGPAVLDEVLDVGVVAVVEAALAAQVVHQHAVEGAVLAEVRARDGERIEVGVLAGDVERVADRDGVRARVLLDDQQLVGLVDRGGGQLGQRRRLGGQRREALGERLGEAVGVAARDADDQPVARVVGGVELAARRRA